MTLDALAIPAREPLAVTVLTSASPRRITKRMLLAENGTLTKENPVQMSRGKATVQALDSIGQFAALLPTLTPAQALCFGRPCDTSRTSFDVFSASKLPPDPQPGQIARTLAHFQWPAGPGVIMIDYDPPDGAEPLAVGDLLALLDAAMPELAGAPRVAWPSASSCMVNTDTGAELAGVRGIHLYVGVDDARDIERVGGVLFARLWLAGHGYIKISKSGALIPRTLIDAAVWQRNRLAFSAGSDCAAPLEQRRGDPLVQNDGAPWLDTRALVADLTQGEQDAVQRAIEAAKTAVAPQAATVREAFAKELAPEIAASTGRVDEDGLAAAQAVALRAVKYQQLMGDFPLILDDGTLTTVGAVLDDREKYHGRKTRDPLEPDYDGGRVVGRLYLIGGRPTLHSFAHGGQTFRLLRSPRRVEAVRGKTSDLTERALDLLRQAPDVFDLGDTLAYVEAGRAGVPSLAVLSYRLGIEYQFWGWRKTPQGELYEADCDPPPAMVRALHEMGGARRLKPLDAVITAPSLRPDGSVLCRPGYDRATRLFFDPVGQDIPHVPTDPTANELAAALDRLMHPFAAFPFAGPLDRSVLLAALLTAAVRAAIPTAPGFAFDAPTQGSGKTLLARCVGILASGGEPGIWPHVAGRDAEPETRKRLMAALLSSARAMVWDNVLGLFDSAAIASFLTSPTFTDRVLGQSRDATVPNRAMFVTTGNNLCLAGDLPRRFLTCRIDPQEERPFARWFKLDPAEHCRTHRMALVADALTVMRAWLSSPDRQQGQRAPGSVASFEQWDALVRQPVAWLARQQPGVWCDPLDSIAAAADADPDTELLGDLLGALHSEFGTQPSTTADVLRKSTLMADAHDERALRPVLDAITGGRATNARSVGHALKFRAGRIVNGMRLVRGRPVNGSATWRIEIVNVQKRGSGGSRGSVPVIAREYEK